MPRRRAWPRHRNVRRYEHQFIGWAVALERQGERFVRYFADRKDPDSALAQALAWRDGMITALPASSREAQAALRAQYHRRNRCLPEH